MSQKTAIITGVTGQDGSYLSKLLLDKGYRVIGAYRRSATANPWRLEYLGVADRVEMVSMELLEYTNIQSVLQKYQPDEFYNLAAQSFVATSFEQPLYTGEVDGMSVTRILEAIRTVSPKTRFYQASTSEMFGKVQAIPQTESTPFYPRSPYGVAKLYGHWITVNYRESYNLFACSGILFNHESPLRGLEFVTRKITNTLTQVAMGMKECVELGNMDAKRDWGFAGDYVEGMWRMLQADKPDDYVLATGRTETVRTFCEMTCAGLGMDLQWQGEGVHETGVDRKTGKTVIRINPAFYRPAEVELLIGSPAKAQEQLGWTPKTDLQGLVNMMLEAERHFIATRPQPQSKAA